MDHIGDTEKWINIRNKRYREYVHKDQFRERLERGKYEGITAVIHMGACSSTTERDFDYLWSNNVEYSKMLWRYCTDKQIPFLYASSAATYGDGSLGFDDKMDIRLLEPCNGYGYSKQVFDLWAEKQEAPPQHVGFKFFNVYGSRTNIAKVPWRVWLTTAIGRSWKREAWDCSAHTVRAARTEDRPGILSM